MSEGGNGVGLLIEICRIAEHQRFVVTETHIAPQYLCIGQSLLVKSQHVGVLQKDKILGCQRENERRKEYEQR